jgi:hypothetical protein
MPNFNHMHLLGLNVVIKLVVKYQIPSSVSFATSSWC